MWTVLYEVKCRSFKMTRLIEDAELMGICFWTTLYLSGQPDFANIAHNRSLTRCQTLWPYLQILDDDPYVVLLTFF